MSLVSDSSFYKKLCVFIEICLITLSCALTFSIAISEISFTLALLAWVVKKVMDRDIAFLKNPIYLTLTLFVAFVGLSIANAEYFYISFRGVIKVVKPILMFLMIIDTFKTEKQVFRWIKILCLLFLVVCINGMWQYWSGTDFIRGKEVGFFNEDFRRRITSSFGFYSQLGAFLLLNVSVFAALLQSNAIGRIREKIVFGIMSIAGISCLFHTGSRGAWLAFVGALFFLALIKRSKLIIGLLVLSGVAAIFVLPDYMLVHFDQGRKEQSVSERFMLWERATDVIKAKPFLGVGINNYSKVHHKYDTRKDTRVKGYYAHNGYLQLGAEIGLIGLSFFMLFLLLFFRKVITQLNQVPNKVIKALIVGCLSGCFGFLCLIVVDTVLQSFQTSFLFWVFMGLTMALLQVGLKSDKIEKGNIL